MGLLPTMSDATRPSAQQHGSTTSRAPDVHGPPLVHCRRCDAWIVLSSTRTVSTHRTSEGLVTYFRCPAAHADFYQTPAASAEVNSRPRRSGGRR